MYYDCKTFVSPVRSVGSRDIPAGAYAYEIWGNTALHHTLIVMASIPAAELVSLKSLTLMTLPPDLISL